MTQKQLVKIIENRLGLKIRPWHGAFNKVIHNKTDNPYYVTGAAWNCTNKDDNTVMVVYENEDKQVFVRELSEFITKFRRKLRCN